MNTNESALLTFNSPSHLIGRARESSVSVCIVDSGYALGHPDLPTQPKVQGRNRYTEATGVGETLDWSKDRRGKDCLEMLESLSSMDASSPALKGHGSHIAGVIRCVECD